MTPPLLELRKISCRFPGGVIANDQIDLSIMPGRVHALLGENGAGKSTLMKIAFGMQRPTEGALLWKGKQVEFRSAADARKIGIGMVHQHFMLIPTLQVWENMFLGQEPQKGLILDRDAACEKIQALSTRYGIEVDPTAEVRRLSVGQQQRVEILKALTRDVELLILDEPTAVLTPQEIETLFASLRQLVKEGVTILFISHKLREVRALAHDVSILRRGRKVDTGPIEEMDDQRITHAMVGRSPQTPKATTPPRAHVVLEARALTITGNHQQDAVQDLSFTVHEGEVLGIAGVEGNGQHELIEVLAGLRPLQQGDLRLRPPHQPGTSLDLTTLSTAQRLDHWMAYVPEDRQKHGLVLHHTIQENLLLGRQREPAFQRLGFWQDATAIENFAEEQIDHFAIHPPQPSRPVRNLSGGNQQKVLIAREATRQACFYLVAHPTRGVDIGAIELIHQTLLQLREQGAAILLLSSELPELLTLSDRILVLYNGREMGTRDASQTSETELGSLMLGLSNTSPAP